MCGCKLNQTGRSGAMGSFVALAILTAPVLGAAMYLRSDRESHAGHGAVSTTDIGSPAARGDWSRLVTSKLNGSSFVMADLTGKPAILYFWATWCPQCRVQREMLNTLSREWGDRVVSKYSSAPAAILGDQLKPVVNSSSWTFRAHGAPRLL